MKSKRHMKTIFLTVVSAVVLAVILGLPMTSAQGGLADQLVGTWQVQSTARNCQTGAALRTFPTLNIFAPGGSMLGASAGASPALVSNAFGVWQHTGGPNFTNTFVVLRFNPDGTYAGTLKATRAIVLGPDFNEFTNTESIEIFDPSGNLMSTGCATQTARRLQ